VKPEHTINRPHPDPILLVRAWIPALLWLVVIAIESTSLASSANTTKLLAFVLVRFKIKYIATHFVLLNALLRKVGHCFGYGMLSLFMLRAWWTTLMLRRTASRPAPWRAMVRAWSGRAAILALLTAVTVASMDEWHQMFLPGRTGTVRDIALDSMAAAFVQLVAIAFSDVTRSYQLSAVRSQPEECGQRKQKS